MAPNPFDQFDGPTQANPFDQFDNATAPEPRTQRTWGEAINDTAVQLGEGAANIVGAVPNLVAPESGVAQAINEVAQGYRDKQSAPLRARAAAADRAITAAGEDGIISQVAEAASQYFSDPGLAARFVTTNLPSLIPGVGAAKVAQGAALARGASAVKAAGVATTAAGGVNAVLNAGGARGEAFEDIKRTLEAQGYSPAVAEEMALTDSRVAAAVGALTGFVSGKTGLEGSLFGKAASKGVLKAGVTSVGAELAGEQVEELAPKVTTNALASQYDQRSIGQDVGRTVVETAIGASPGAVIGGGKSSWDAYRAAQATLAGQPKSILDTAGPGQDDEVIQIAPAPASERKPLTEAPKMRPEARLAELEILSQTRSLNETELAEVIRLTSRDDSEARTTADSPSANPFDQFDQAASLPAELAQVDSAEGVTQDQARNSSAPPSLNVEGTPLPADSRETARSVLPTERLPDNFWQYASQRGFKPSELQVGTPEHAALQAEYRALRAGQSVQPMTATASEPGGLNQPEAPSNASPDATKSVAYSVNFQGAPYGTQATQAQQAAQEGPAQAAAVNGRPTDASLQNRDRSRTASVVQMMDIARNPDYMRLATSRTPDSGAPMVFATGDDISQIPDGNGGRTDVAVMSDGQRVPFRYAVVSASQVEPSNFADGRRNPAFSAELTGTLKALNNGRTAGLRAAYEMGTAGTYQQELIADTEAHGVPLQAIARTPNPILVRIYSEQNNTADMAAKSQGQGLGMSPTELAAQDAPMIDTSVLAVYQPGEVTSATNRDFVRAFVGKLQGAGQDVATLMTADGTLSPAGRQRIQAALLQSAYDEADLVTELFDSLDTEIKSIGEALKTVAGEWANMRDSARQGLINPEADITGNLMQAVGMVRRSRRERLALDEMILQPDLMTGQVPDELTVGLLRVFHTAPYMTRAVGRERLVKDLREYLRMAMATSAFPDMFGQTVAPGTILQDITYQGASNAQPTTQEIQGQPGRLRDPGGGDGSPGPGDTRPVADGFRQEPGADRQGERENAAGSVRQADPAIAESDEAAGLISRGAADTRARLEALRREALPIVRGQAYAKRGISLVSDGGVTAVVFKGETIATIQGPRTRENLVRAIEGELSAKSREMGSARGASAAARNEDVGQQLYANRRNFTGRGLKWDDVAELNDTLKVKEVTKAKVWPRPNYEQLVTDGMPALLARLVKQVYDGISAGPTVQAGTPPTNEQLKLYIDTLAKVREGLFGFVNDKRAVADFAGAVVVMTKGQKSMAGPIAITDMLQSSVDAKATSETLIRRVWPEEFQGVMRAFQRGTRANGELTLLGGNKALAALQFNRSDFSKWAGDLGKGWPGKREAWQVQGYRVLEPGEYTIAEPSAVTRYNRDSGKSESTGETAFAVRAKEGRSSWRRIGEPFTEGKVLLALDGGSFVREFDTKDQAIEAAREKVKRTQGAGQDIRGTNIEESERTGPARRQDGEDITSQRLMDTFGFRGVNFGREGWIKQAERQAYLNQAYDGLLDLAEILGVPPKAMSLDGKLGIAFGAQGKGKFAAHFVPGVNEINLTKTRGAGTLAHEWGHALDHHFATQAGLDKDAEPMLSEHAYKGEKTSRVAFQDGKYVNQKDVATFGDGIRPEIVQAFRAIYQAMEKRKESLGEAKMRRDAALEGGLKSLNGWLKAARRAIEGSTAENKADLLTEFDQHAEKLREGDTGDGFDQAGKQVYSARVAAVRNLIKDATGRLWGTDETKGLESNARYVRSLIGKQAADADHEPQKVATQYKRDSLAMDKEKGGKAYWSTPTEMFARAFELYVHDKLSQRGNRNTFLTDADQRASSPVKVADTSSAFSRGAGAERDLYLYPVGQEREALRGAFDSLVGTVKVRETERGLALYEPERNTYTGATDEPTDRQYRASEPQGADRPGPAATDAVRGDRDALPGRARITALGIAADIQRAGSAALVGRTVRSADDLAELAQVYRDPRYETFRVFFVKDGYILHATGVSARLPGQTPMVPADMSTAAYVQSFKDQMAELRADGYYLLHNHPSGDPTPSRDDQRATEYLAAQVPGLKAHVVINSNRYAIVRSGQSAEIKTADFGPELLLIPSKPSPVLNALVRKPDDLVSLGKSLQKPDWVTLIGTDSANKVRITADFPTSALTRDPKVLAGQVRRLMRQSGARHMHLVGSDADVASAPVQQALREGVLLDAVGNTGRTQSERGVGGQSGAFQQTPGRRVAEPEGDGYQRDSIGSKPPPTPGPRQESAWSRSKAKVMQLTSPQTIDKLLYEFQDKLVDLKRLREHIREIGGTITDLNDAYLGEELFHKRLAKRTEDFLDKEIKPLLANMRSRAVSMAQLEQYLHARHAPEANRVLAERNPTRAMIDKAKTEASAAVRDLQLQLQRATARGSATKAIEEALVTARAEAAKWDGAQAFRGDEAARLSLSGMSDQDARAYMDSLTPAKRANLEALAAKVDALQAKTLDALEAYGLIDKESLNAWRSAYEFYVPLHRDEAHAESDRHPIGQGFSVKGTGMKSRVGSNEKVTNILAHIALQREAALTRGEKNHVVKKLYLMAAQNPDEDFWAINKPPQIKTIDPNTGFVRTSVDPRFKNLPNVVMVRIAGRDQAIVFNEHNPQAVRLAEAMKNLDVGDLHVVLGLAAKGTRWFASVNTQYNPIFGLINFARDVQSGLLNLSTTEIAGKQKEVAAKIPVAMRAIYRERRGKSPGNAEWARLWDEFQDVGGTTGYRDMHADAKDRANVLAKELAALDRGDVSKAAYAVVDWLSHYNETMENSVRLAAYRVAMDQGMTKERAASLAKNVTVNFNRKGRQAREIGALYAFFNAAIQGTTRMVETLRGPIGRRVIYGGVMLGVVNTLIGMAVMGADDDDESDNWEQIPEFIKERSIVIPLGREDYLTIPMPLGFHVFPNIGRIAVEFALGGSEKTAGRQIGKLLMAMADAFNPLGGSQNLGQMVAPTVIDPVVALMQNRDWTGKPIYRENANGLDPQPGHRMAKDSASTPSRLVAEGINWVTGGTEYRPGAWSPTPDQLDYVIGQLTGGLGRELLKVNQTIASTITGDELPPYKVPLVGRLYGNTRGPAGQSGKFYENVTLLNELENEYKGQLRAGQDVEQLEKDEPLLGLVGQGNAAENQIRQLRTLKRNLSEDKGPGFKEEVQSIDLEIGQIMADLNKEVAKLRRGVTQ